jgi:serine/threonine protein kinase
MACELVAGLKAQIREGTGVPVEEQHLFFPGQRAVPLREPVRFPDGMATLCLVRSSVDPCKTDLGHFWFRGAFSPLPSGDFLKVSTLYKGTHGKVQHHVWCKPEGNIQVAVKKVAAVKLRSILDTETDERVSHFRLGSNKPIADNEDNDDPLAEIGILSYLSRQSDLSSNLVRMLGVFSDSACVWVVMDLAEGGELFPAISSGRVQGERQAGRYTREMLDAVSYLHKHHIGHRDVSLENAVLTKAGVLQIIDFGMSVRSHSFSGVPFRYFRRVGKECYRAPECYVPDVEEVTNVLCPAKALPGDVRMVRLPCDLLAEVRLPDTAQPGKSCKVEVWGYAVQPADVFAVGVCVFSMCYRCLLFKQATFADPYFAWIHAQGESSIAEAIRSWGMEPFALATSLLEQMLCLDPARRPSAAECLAHPWLAESEGL